MLSIQTKSGTILIPTRLNVKRRNFIMKLSALILAFICVFAFVGCNSNTATDNPSAEPTPNSWGNTILVTS